MAGEGHLRLYLIKHDLLLFHSNCVHIFCAVFERKDGVARFLWKNREFFIANLYLMSLMGVTQRNF